MIKLLQKYKMYILVVAGILIIVSFLLADLLRQLNTYNIDSQRRYTIAGEKVTQGDLQKANLYREGIERTVPTWSQFVNSGVFDDNEVQWQLLAAAAQRAGLQGGPVDGRNAARNAVISTLQQQAFQTQREKAQSPMVDWRTWLKNETKLDDAQLEARIEQLTDNALATAGVSGEVLNNGANAISQWTSIQRLLSTYENVAQTSENRMAAEARRRLDEAVIKFVYVPVTDAQITTGPTPTPEALQAQFDKYKDTLPKPDGTGFGYREPDRVSYSWFILDRQAVSRAVVLDPVEVQKRAQGRTATDATTLRRTIEDELRGEMTIKAIDEFNSAFRTEVLRSTATLPDKDGFKALPPTWVKPDLAAMLKTIIDRLAAERRITIPMPTVGTTDKPQDRRAVIQQTGVGLSMLARTGATQSIYLFDQLFQAKEFGKPAGKLPIQLGLPVTVPFTNGQGNLVFVMLTAVHPEASPTSLDQVRDRVERDVRKINAVAKLKADMEAKVPGIAILGITDAPTQLTLMGYPGLAVQSGLTRRLGYPSRIKQEPDWVVTESGMPAQPEVQSEEFTTAVMTRADKIDPALKVQDDSALERTFVHQVADGVILAQVAGLKPFTLESFQQGMMNPSFRMALERADNKFDPAKDRPFATEALAKRLNVVGLESKPKPADPEQAPTPAPAQAPAPAPAPANP